eukprot:CAMPEP_0174909564 /NCGR_PEP_ID=MMETSP0167-20121228/69163_1 /TAXON_ID=38298 /ORGANISM="Rhodella maculata, Strain CCMP736" /LENGTH=319 /DNA_ID=CAMNT_0016153595 /DNA_START=74 /DNA_END=1033 /DNA_ORIENTATION=-
MATEVFDSNYLLITLLVTFVFQLVFFLITAVAQFDTLTDLAGSTNFLILALLTFFLAESYHARQILITVCAALWAVRLATFLFARILIWGHDNRFDEMRNSIPKLAAFWFGQFVWVWVVSLPVTVTNATVERDPKLGAADFVGVVMFAVGLLLEAVSDWQKLKFKQDKEKKGKWCDVGLWKYSRHPNYFGEILLWWGLFAISTPILSNGQWAVLASPLLISVLLLFVSGLPLLEASANEKYGGNPEFAPYRARTSIMVPMPNGLWEALPGWLKRTVLLEWKMYEAKGKEEGKEEAEGYGATGKGPAGSSQGETDPAENA